jgi:hypothetical protein
MKPIVILTGAGCYRSSRTRYFSPVLAETRVPNAPAGKTLAEATIPRETGCSVVGLYGYDNQPNPTTILNRDTEIGTPESEQRFLKLYRA